MGICPNCGSWVDEGDICGCCGGSGSYEPDDPVNTPDSGNGNNYFPKRDEYSKKAWNCYMDFKDEEALYYINQALSLDRWHSNNWNRKGIILEGLKRYGESEECYNRSLELRLDNVVRDNKARMLYDWAVDLIEESKKLPDGIGKLKEAQEKNMKAMSALSGDGKESIDKYLHQRDSINFYIGYEKEYQRNLEILKTHPKEDMFTITGRNFYKNDIKLTQGMPLKLVKEPDNEFDVDAIAVYAKDVKIGYVANNDHTKHELTSKASELQDKIQNTAQGEFLLYLSRYAAIQFFIGRIIN